MGPGPAPGGILDRGAELAAIAAAIRAAVAGTGSAVLIEGAAGIGKTRLLGYACEEAASAGMQVLTARAAEFEAGFAWGTVRQLFGPVAGPGGPAGRPDDAARLAAPALVPEKRQEQQDSFAVRHGLYWLAAGLARRAPLLLGIDDLHWADEPSLRFAAHLARRLDGLPVLLVLTVREPRSATAQQKALTAGLAAEPGVTVLRPAVLGAAACGELISRALGTSPAPPFVQSCCEITGGNPLLLQALLGSLVAEGASGTAAEVPHLRRLTPSTVSRRVLLQLGRMPAEVLAAARAIAVLGTVATAGRVARLAGLDADACAEAIGALMAERLVEGDRELRFVHPLVRSAVYEDLAPPVRQRWHGRVARMLEADGAAAQEVTVHLLAAGTAGDCWVVDRLRAAAADALGRGAPGVARLCLERALAEPPAAADRPGVLLELGRAETMQAPAAAAAHLEEALRAAAARPAGPGQPGQPEQAMIALALAQALALGGRFSAAVGVLRDAISGLPGENGPSRRCAAGRAAQHGPLGPVDAAADRPAAEPAAGQGRARRGDRPAAARQPGHRARGGGRRP